MALVPDVAKKLVGAGWDVWVQAGAGTEAAFSDSAYSDAGATVAPDAATTVAGAESLTTSVTGRPVRTAAAGAVALSMRGVTAVRSGASGAVAEVQDGSELSAAGLLVRFVALAGNVHPPAVLQLAATE